MFALENDQITEFGRSASNAVVAFRRGIPGAAALLTTADPAYNAMRRLAEWMKNNMPRSSHLQSWQQYELQSQAEAEADAMLAAVYHYARANDIDKGSQFIFKRFDDLMRHERFDVCDWILRRANVANMQEDLIFAVVAITRPVKDKMPCRAQYLKAAEVRMGELIGNRDARALLASYE